MLIHVLDIIEKGFFRYRHGIVPKPEVKDMCLFWCECIVTGLEGMYGVEWDKHWAWVVSCFDTLVLNYVKYHTQRNDADSFYVKQIAKNMVDYISQKCLETKNQSIGKLILVWIIELADGLEF